MAKKINILIDTDIFIDYLNHQLFRDLFESGRFQVFYSIVTKKELLAKEGLGSHETREIRSLLKKFRLIPLNAAIVEKYSELRKNYPHLEKEDCLIAAAAIIKKIPLATRNYKHYRFFKDLVLYFRKP